MDTQQREKILAAYFAATKQNELTVDFEAFVYWMRPKGKFEQLKQWWDEMEALSVLRRVNYLIQYSQEQIDERILELPKFEGQTITFKTQFIGRIYDYQRIALPQEMQTRIAYDSLIERFLKFLQREKYAIRLSESDLGIRIFVPQTDSYTEFDLVLEWDKFIKFAYSRSELYKSFILFVNHTKITQTDRPGAGVGYVRFPPATKEMAYCLAAFYFAALESRILYDKIYNDGDKATRDAQTKVEEYGNRLNQPEIAPQKRNSNEKKLEEWQIKLAIAKEKFEDIKRVNQTELKHSLSKLREQIGEEDFERIRKLSRQFNGTARRQFGPSVKPKSKNGNIENTIIEILNDQLVPPTCPLIPISQIPRFIERTAGDNKGANFCYSCGKRFSKGDQKYEANRFVLGTSAQRPQSGGSEARPHVCGECFTVAFVCPVKITSGAIVVQLALRNEIKQTFSVENQLRMLTLGELNLVAGRYLLINCREFVGSGNSRILVSEKIGQVQYTLWRVACTLPAEALGTTKFTLFTGGAEIPLKTRHFVWLSLLNEIFSPNLVIKHQDNIPRDNIPLGQAIRLIEKDEVIAAIYKMATAAPDKKETNQIWETSYHEKRTLEELREKHCTLLEQLPEKGEKSKMNQAQLFRHVAGLTGLTYAYCDYVRSEVNKDEKLDTEREVSKLIEKVTNPNFFNYAASEPLTGTRATMYRKDDNYFCYDQAKCLLKEELKLDLSSRGESTSKRGQSQLPIYFDDIVNAYTTLFEKYYESANEQRKLCYQLKLSLYAKFANLFQKTSKGE